MGDSRGPAAATRSPEDDPAPDPGGAGSDELGDALARALLELRAIVRDLFGLAGVTLDRFRVGARVGALRLLLLSWLVLTAVAATVFAAWILVDGVAGGLGVLLGGRLWAGRAIAGTVILSTLGVVALVVRARMRRAELDRLKDKYEGRPDPAREKGGPR
jgi:hypothetical protein